MTTTTIGARIRGRIRHTPLFPLLRRRRFHAFSLGGPKTGTTSIAMLFEGNFRSAHEPLYAGTMEHVLGALNGAYSRDELVRYLRWRDRELYLEMESSHLLTVFVDLLVELFPKSRFILTVRDPASWLDSFINEQLKARAHWATATRIGPRAHFFPALYGILCKADTFPFEMGERVLEENGLYTLDGFFSWWAEHNRSVLDSVPPERLLVLPTDAISSSIDRIADFLEVPAELLNTAGQHANRASSRHGLLDRIDPSLLERKITQHCSGVYDALRDRFPPG